MEILYKIAELGTASETTLGVKSGFEMDFGPVMRPGWPT